MRRYVNSQMRPDLGAWVAMVAKMERLDPKHYAIGIEIDGVYRAGVVYENWTKRDVHMHVAIQGVHLGVAFVWMAFDFPFNVLGVERITGMVPASNKVALEFDLKLGFVVEGIHREAAQDGGDLVSIGMLRRECRWLGLENRAMREVMRHEQIKAA